MVDSILNSIKLDLGIPDDDTAFDQEIIMHINAAFLSIHQVAIDSDSVYSITDANNTWAELGVDLPNVLEEYIYLYTKMIFDPPETSAKLNAYQSRMDMLEFRINVHNDGGGGEVYGV